VLLDPVLAAAAMAMSSVSVVTNALRLRRLKRPVTTAAILHPPMRTRLSEVTYLAGMAAVALALGVGLTALTQTDGYRRGMNGTLAWTLAMGMPVRPTMTEMMRADVAPVAAAIAGVHAEILTPADIRVGEPAHLEYRLTAADGQALTDVGLSHEQWIHLVAMRQPQRIPAHPSAAHGHARRICDRRGLPDARTLRPEQRVQAAWCDAQH